MFGFLFPCLVLVSALVLLLVSLWLVFCSCLRCVSVSGCLSLCVELLMFFPVVVALPVLIWRVMSFVSIG